LTADFHVGIKRRRSYSLIVNLHYLNLKNAKKLRAGAVKILLSDPDRFSEQEASLIKFYLFDDRFSREFPVFLELLLVGKIT